MKKSIKSVLAKSLAVAMAFSLAGIAPTSDAAAKKPTLTKKVTVTVGKTIELDSEIYPDKVEVKDSDIIWISSIQIMRKPVPA